MAEERPTEDLTPEILCWPPCAQVKAAECSNLTHEAAVTPEQRSRESLRPHTAPAGGSVMDVRPQTENS